MQIHVLEREQRLPQPPGDVFPFFAETLNLERLTPAFLHFKVLSQEPAEIGRGTLIRYRLRLRGLPVRWLTRIEQWQPSRRFVDLQLKGPYRYWHHSHDFEPDSGGTLMRDTVRYAMRAGRMGEAVHDRIVEPDLAAIFDYRAEQIAKIFASG
ncbi:MAG: SRPBCC family protein [Actinomycetota bacterium]|nr:SRPBCC family protein [Actinomycetota bacterium]